MKSCIRLPLFLLVAATLLAPSAPALASLVPERTRLVIEDGRTSASLVVRNTAPAPYLAQSWIDAGDGAAITSPAMALPPVQRIEGNEQGVVRVNLHSPDALPNDRESVFYLNVQEIPPKSEQPNVLQIAVKSRIKVFYRPKAVALPRGSNPAEQLKVRLDRAAGVIRVSNPTPWHVSFTDVSWQDGEVNKLRALMAAPMADLEIPLPAGAQGDGHLYLANIDDYGATRRLRFDCLADACTFVADARKDER